MIRIDELERDHLTIWTVLGLAVGLGALASAGYYVAVWEPANAALSGIVALFALFIGVDNSLPDLETACDSCGEHLTLHSGRDETDEIHIVRRTETPRRLHVGPLSVVVKRDRREYHYCSSECSVDGPIDHEGNSWGVGNEKWQREGAGG